MLSFLLFLSVIFGNGYRLWFFILFVVSIFSDKERIIYRTSDKSEE
jgi:hypothetical protein